MFFETDYELIHDEKNDSHSNSNSIYNVRAPLDEYTLYEIEHDRQLDVISNFKYTISKEAEFCGIYSLSAYVILRAFMDSENIIVNFKNYLSEEQLLIFKSVYFEICNTFPEEIYLHKIALNISNKIYV
jgi:hypothetical protein